ncbi:MAG: tetratricopeptide repeat protein [Actinomycetota bacterium]
MARSGARRKQRPTPKPQARGAGSPASTRHEFSAVEAAMFFPKLRRQAKWVFVFLALTFGIGFVAFGIGSGSGGLGDIFQGLGQSSSTGPSVNEARDKIEKGNLAAYKDLSTAYQAENKPDEALAAGEKYVQARPKDYDFMRTLASQYEGKAARLRAEATTVQEELTAQTGGTVFALPQNTPLGRALGPGKIDQELTTAANAKLTEQYSSIQESYTRATRLYQSVARAKPSDVLLQLLLAQAAYQAQLVPTAVKAYARVIELAPDSAEAQQARQQIQLLKLQAKAANVPAG